MAPRRSKDVLRSIQDSFRLENLEIYKNIEKHKEFQGFLGGLGGFIEARTLPKTGQVGARTGQVGARTSRL